MIKSPQVQEIVGTLSTELRAKVDELVDYEEILEDTQASIEVAKRDIRRLKTALEALTGNDIPIRVDIEEAAQEVTRDVPQPLPTPAPKQIEAPVQAYVKPQAPVCTACGGDMYINTITMKSGRLVNVLRCSECNNEKPLGVAG